MGKTTFPRLDGLWKTSLRDLFRWPVDRGRTCLILERLLGMGDVPQGNSGFPDLTVAENLALATAVRGRGDHMTMDAILDLFPRLGNC